MTRPVLYEPTSSTEPAKPNTPSVNTANPNLPATPGEFSPTQGLRHPL